MSRVPEKTRTEFIEFANGEFAGDYGCTLTFVWDCFKRYQQIINTQDTKLDYIITMLKNNTPKIEERKVLKMLGRSNDTREVKNEQT